MKTKNKGLQEIQVGDIINVNKKKWIAVDKKVNGSEIEVTYKEYKYERG